MSTANATAPAAVIPPETPTDVVQTPAAPAQPVQAQPQKSQRARVFFKKVLANMPLFVGGNRVPVEPLAQNTGVIALDQSDAMAGELTVLAQKNKGGVVAIDEATYEDLKKKLPLSASLPRLPRQRLQVLNLNPFRKSSPPSNPSPKAGAEVAAAGNGRRISPEGRVGPTGGSGAGAVGESAPAPAVFKPATGNKRLPVTKAPSGASLSGGVPDTSDD